MIYSSEYVSFPLTTMSLSRKVKYSAASTAITMNDTIRESARELVIEPTIYGMKVEKLTLQGKAEENAARLSEETFTLGSELRQQLPAYSLTVLKIIRPEE